LETLEVKSKENVVETINNIVPEQKKANETNQRKRKISNDKLEKLTENRRVTKDLKKSN